MNTFKESLIAIVYIILVTFYTTKSIDNSNLGIRLDTLNMCITEEHTGNCAVDVEITAQHIVDQYTNNPSLEVVYNVVGTNLYINLNEMNSTCDIFQDYTHVGYCDKIDENLFQIILNED